MKNLFQLFKIKNFNKKTFGEKIGNSNKLILCEFLGNKSNQIAFSYLINALKKKENCTCYSFLDISNINFLDKLKLFIHKILGYNLGNFFIYKSFNTKKFLFVKKNKMTEEKTKIFLKDFTGFNSKGDLINFKIEKILIGDLIYDSFLRKTGFPTLEINDDKLKKFFIDTLNIFYYWLDFFEKNQVTGVVVSDTSYTSTMIARISAFKKIPTYQCNWENVHRISEDNLFCYGKFIFYKEIFNKFSKDQKKIALDKSKDRIKIRLGGKLRADDLFYTDHSSFHSEFEKNKILSKSDKKKILIASHFFIDAPHGYGPDSIIFPDFYEWLNYLNDLSKKTDFEWYIKCHPHSKPKEDEIFKNFIKDKSNLIEIPKYSSHLQIIKEGINCVLTVYGTIAWEYAYYKVPVITASRNNPHIKYDFCAHAKNIDEYEQMILNFDKLKLNFSEENICEFYFMHNMYSRCNWLFDSYEKVFKQIKGFENLPKLKFYDYWIKNADQKKNEKIFSKLNKFLNSKNLFINNDTFF